MAETKGEITEAIKLQRAGKLLSIFICSFTGSLLESMGGGPMSFPGSSLGDLSSGKTTLLENLSERRDSTSSTLSSVYTLSRRSSGISPCYSSRRSSQASQFGANRPSNLSSADSYDPISADISRRSSQVSQCGGSSGGAGGYGGRGLPSPLSLTPAQHYRLKAKYAAATGGAPPTPLPYMDQMCLKTHTALYGESQESSPINKVPSRQYSSYATRSLMPHEVPSNIPRRASDPVRRMAIDLLSQPQMQRYNSMGTLSRTTQPHPPPAADRQHLSQQSCLRLDGSPHRYPYSLQPPSISENVTMEMITGNVPEENLMLPDLSIDNRVTTNPQDFQGTPNLQQQSYHQRRMAIVNTNMNSPSQVLATSSMSLVQQRHMCPSSPRDSKADLLVQWNKVSLGPMDVNQHYSKPQGKGNLAVLQQNQNFGSFHSHLSSNQQMIQNLVNTTQQKFQLSSNLNEGIRSQYRFNEGNEGSCDKNGNTTYPPCNNPAAAVNGSMLSPTYKQEPVDMEIADMPFADAGFQPVQVKIEDCDGSIMISDQQNCNMSFQNPLQTGNQSHLQPRPPIVPKSLNRHHSVPKAMQQTRHLSNANPDVASKLPSSGVLGLDCSDSSDDNALYYTGQIQVFEPNGNLDHHVSPVVNVPPFEKNAVSPCSGNNQASRTDCNATLEQVQIDFDSMLDDGDHSSLVSGTLSPGLLQSLSQSSSRLTTPRNSVTLPSVPVATGNMAIGDMSSLLTALAEESKFLNLMS